MSVIKENEVIGSEVCKVVEQKIPFVTPFELFNKVMVINAEFEDKSHILVEKEVLKYIYKRETNEERIKYISEKLNLLFLEDENGELDKFNTTIIDIMMFFTLWNIWDLDQNIKEFCIEHPNKDVIFTNGIIDINKLESAADLVSSEIIDVEDHEKMYLLAIHCLYYAYAGDFIKI